MKLNKCLFLLLTSFLLSNMAMATHLDKKTIEERTAPVGKIYIKGDKLPTPVVAIEAVKAEPRSGESLVTAKCSMCHANAGVGAPLIGHAKDWEARAAKGIDALLTSATKGLNAMPPMGMCTDCSSDELKGAIEYMLSKSQ